MRIIITVQLNDCTKAEAQTVYDNIFSRLRGLHDMEIHPHYVNGLQDPSDPQYPVKP